MSGFSPRWVGLVLATMVPTMPVPAAEEAWRGDGRRLEGALTLDDGRLRFTPTAGDAFPVVNVARVRFSDASPTPFRVGDGRRVLLRDGQRITGQILELNETQLAVRAVWAARVEVPRAAVASIEPLAGWRTVAVDDFRDGLKQFTATGEPSVKEADGDSGSRWVVLRADGQGLTYTLGEPFTAGRAAVNFREEGRPTGARWTFGMRFSDGEHSRRISVAVVGGGESYTVDVVGHKGEARQVRRTPGWHRLSVTFSQRSLRVLCDEDVLWYNLDGWPGGRLKEVTMRCQSIDGADVRGTVAWTEFCLERAVVEHPRPPTDASQDDLRLSDDDQLFGHVLGADRRAVRIEGRFGKRSLPWTAVAGCSFRRPAAPLRADGRGLVRVQLRSGLGPEPDVLDGAVTTLDEKRMILRHVVFGEVVLERSRLRELRPLASSPK